MKYCNLCGAQLPAAKDKAAVAATEKRLDDYLDGLFWITVFGLGFILGGMVLIKEALHLSDRILVAYLIISSMAFLVNFGLSLWQVVRMVRGSKEEAVAAEAKLATNKLGSAEERKPLAAAGSVTAETTRSFEPSPKEQVTR
jgi:hypothetical protein